METWEKYDAERGALANDLDGIDPSAWDVQSLCAQWKVRHVVAHLNGGGDVHAGSFFLGMVKTGFNFDKLMCSDALRDGAAAPDELLTGLRASIGKHKTPPGAKPFNMLIDTVCHSLDIRRPLGIQRQLPEETLVEVASNLKNIGFPIKAKKRVAGLKFVATDIDWSSGDGPEVRGPADSIILAMGGRKAGLDDLTGDGVATLAGRF